MLVRLVPPISLLLVPGGRSRSAWLRVLGLLAALALDTACSRLDHYVRVEQSLRAGDAKQAAAIVEQAESSYGSKSRLLYELDRGLTLHLAGDYALSNTVLEQAEQDVERLYTRSIRSETAAFLTNDTSLPYEGEAYEHVMINVVKAVNYVALGQIQEALVEARRIDHRLNVLTDQAKDPSAYHEDGFARYLTGVLYEAQGDLNNAFIAYRKAVEAYETMRSWTHVSPPSQLRMDALRTAEALQLTVELDELRQRYPETVWQSRETLRDLAQVVFLSYNGRAPHKEDRYLDLPISLDALQLVLLNRGLSSHSPRTGTQRGVDSVLYGLNGHVVRVALPKLVVQKTQVMAEELALIDAEGHQYRVRSEVAHNISALAEHSLSGRMPAITVKALARAAFKFAMAEGATRGAQMAAGKDAAPLVGLAVGLLTKGLAVASEEADKRSWQILPDEIHVARVWVPAGTYRVAAQPPGSGERVDHEHGRQLILAPGQTALIIQRVMQ